MSLIRELDNIITSAEEEYKKLLAEGQARFSAAESQLRVSAAGQEAAPGSFRRVICAGRGQERPDKMLNRIYHCDNLELLAEAAAGGFLKNRISLIYCDPPFFTGTDQEAALELFVTGEDGKRSSLRLRQRAYSDRWNGDMNAYLKMLAVRLYFMRDTLREDGSIFIHLDWRAAHPVKLIMDEIFGPDNFINEIIWSYKSGGAAKRHFSRKHDTILFYGKSDKYKFHLTEKEKSYNRGFRPYHFKGVEEFHDEIGWYTLVNPRDVWQMDMVGRSSSERLNYATQKPEALLRRIITTVTDPGDLCADFFCGSGTLAAAAAGLDRDFVCSDMGGLAVTTAMKRLFKGGYGFELWKNVEKGSVPDLTPHPDTPAPGQSAATMNSQTLCQNAPTLNSQAPDQSAISRDKKESFLPLRAGDLQQGLDIMEREPEAFTDYIMEGRRDREGCLHVNRVTFRTLKEDLTLDPDFQTRVKADLFGRLTDL